MDLFRLSEKAVREALSKGADQVDVYAQVSRRVGVRIERGGVRSSTITYLSGISVRAYSRGGVGFAYAERLDEETAVNVARRAASLAKQAQPDPDFKSLPEPRKAPEVPGLYDEAVESMDVEEAVEGAKLIIDAGKLDPRVALNGGVSFSATRYVLANSLGVSVGCRITSVGCSAMAVVKRNGDVGSYYEWDSGRLLKDVDFARVGETAVKGASKYLGARKVRTETLPIVFGVNVGYGLADSLLNAANAESVQRGRSYLAGKLGSRIASELLTVVDDGTVPAGLASSTYDGEGVPKRRLLVIDHGVLKTYLHNSYTANKAGVETTASAVRGLGGYGISRSNVQVKPGDWTVEEMISDMAEGMYFELGGIWADTVTGDISKPIDFGFKVEKGQLAYPVKATMIGANILELAAEIDAVSKEYREEPGFILPAIRVRRVRVAGAR